MKYSKTFYHLRLIFVFLWLSLIEQADAAVTNSPETLWSMKLHSNAVPALAFASDGKSLASGAMDGSIRLWDVASGQSSITLTNNPAEIYNLWFRSDGILVSWDAALKLKLWRLSDSILIREHSYPIGEYKRSAVYSPAIDVFVGVVSQPQRQMTVWNVETDSVVFEPSQAKRLGLTVFATFSDGDELAVGVFNMEQYFVDIYYTSDWTLKQTLEGGGAGIMGPVIYSPDKTFLVVPGFANNFFQIWQLPAGAQYGVISIQSEFGFYFVQFTPDSRLLVITGPGHPVRIWLMRPGWNDTPLLTYNLGPSIISSMSVAPKGGLIAFGMEDGTVTVIRTPLIIVESKVNNNELTLQWAGGADRFQVQARLAFGVGNWQNLGEPTTARGATNAITGGAMFYRVISLAE